jgi:addiction module RelE/StbE family toxin
MKLRWTRRAESQLLEIGRYIARDKPGAARRWVEALRRRAAQAAEHPLAGRQVPELDRPDLREVVLRGYRIVYRVADDAIEVLTVFESHRLLKSALAAPDPTTRTPGR